MKKSYKFSIGLLALLFTTTLLLFACGDKESSDSGASGGVSSGSSSTNSSNGGGSSSGTNTGTTSGSNALLTGELAVYESPAAFTEQTGQSISAYNEAPMLQELVSSGKLPPVEKRIGSEPLVVQPADAIGLYGGILRGAATTPTEEGHDVSTILEQRLFFTLPDLSTVYPNSAKSVEFTNDNKTMIIHLREGMKWSDGEPFTADDFIFWYECILPFPELQVIPNSFWTIGGEQVVLSKIDTYSVQFDFAVPSPTIPAKLAIEHLLIEPFAPAHYLKEFHLNYNDNVEAEAKAAGFSSWTERFKHLYTLGERQMNMDLPTLFPWVWKGTDSSGNRFFERNPYFWKVDIEGNQLPYIDELHRLVVQNIDGKKLGAMNGSFDIATKDLALTDYPMFKENEDKGNYRAFLGDGAQGSYMVFGFNLTWDKDPGLVDIMSDVRFRQAMSLAINRDEINEVIFMGQGIPRQLGPIPQTSYVEPWMNDYYAEYDVDKANTLLDEMGLKWDAKHEYRLRPDGTTLILPHEYWRWADIVATTIELTTEYWKAIGIKIDAKELERSLYFERRIGNDIAFATWGGDFQVELPLYVNPIYCSPPYQAEIMAPWRLWYASEGADGMKPPKEVIELFDWTQQRTQVQLESDEYVNLSKKIANRNLEKLYQIGTVGLVPNVVIFNKDLLNTPTKGVFTSDSLFLRTYMGESFYFAQ